jgi:hypothetical protein
MGVPAQNSSPEWGGGRLPFTLGLTEGSGATWFHSRGFALTSTDPSTASRFPSPLRVEIQ